MKQNGSKEILDEMQDRKLLKIQESGFWLLFWVLFAAILIQALLGTTLRQLAGELAALFAASAYMLVSTLKNGLWTRSYAPTLKSNLISSLIPALFLGIFNAVRAFIILKRPVQFSTIAQFAAISIIVYILCLALLELSRLIYNRRRGKLDDIEDEVNEDEN